MKRLAENVVRIEAEALQALAERLAGPMAPAFVRAVELLQICRGRVVVTGMGKSGIVGRKIAATLSSTGTPALFLHPAEAMHGDLGMVVRGDVVVALSASGETSEILQLLPTIKRLQVPLVSFTCDAIRPAPSGAARKKLGITTVLDGRRLVGIISDGDLRRLLERQGRNGRNVLDLTAAECMTRAPKTVAPDTYAASALDIMEQKKITSLVVVDGEGNVAGIVHLHDLWETEVI